VNIPVDEKRKVQTSSSGGNAVVSPCSVSKSAVSTTSNWTPEVTELVPKTTLLDSFCRKQSQMIAVMGQFGAIRTRNHAS